MNTTKDKKQMNFEEEIIDFIEDKIEANVKQLFHQQKYSELSESFSKLNLQLLSTLDENQRELFHSYQNIALKLNSYQNTLAYYLGLNEEQQH